MADKVGSRIVVERPPTPSTHEYTFLFIEWPGPRLSCIVQPLSVCLDIAAEPKSHVPESYLEYVLLDQQIEITPAKMHTYSIGATGELSVPHMLAQSPEEVIGLSYVDAARVGDIVKYVNPLIPLAVVDEYIGGGGGDVEVVVAGDGEVPHPARPLPGGVAAEDGGGAA